MKREVIELQISDIYRMRDEISFPDFQREAKLWPLQAKQRLIDSIFRNIDIPKIYFSKSKNNQYDVIDGQQRLWAIWEYIDNEYSCAIHGSSKKFKGLSPSEKKELLSYKLQITQIHDVDDEYLRELFLRLQLGLLLITGEKLHASSGAMRDFIFNKMAKAPFIRSVKISEKRFIKQSLCAQICINSFYRAKSNEYSRTRYEDLKSFFDTYSKPQGNELKYFNDRCGIIENVLKELNKYFLSKAALLKNRSFILTVYLFVESLVEKKPGEVKTLMPIFVEFIDKFWKSLKKESKKDPFHRKNKHLYEFESYLNNAPGEKYQISNRDSKLNEFFNYYLNPKSKGSILGD